MKPLGILILLTQLLFAQNTNVPNFGFMSPEDVAALESVPIGSEINFKTDQVYGTGQFLGIKIDPVTGQKIVILEYTVTTKYDLKNSSEGGGSSGGSSGGVGGGSGTGTGTGDVGNSFGSSGSVGASVWAGTVAVGVQVALGATGAQASFENLSRQAQLAQEAITQIKNSKIDIINNGAVGLRNIFERLNRPTLDARGFNQELGPPKTNDFNFDSRTKNTWNKLEKVKPSSQHSKALKSFGQQAVRSSVNYHLQGEISKANESLSVGERIADLLIGIDPITSVLRNSSELFTGINFVTGKSLTSFERAVAGASFVFDIATLGAAAPVKGVARSVWRIAADMSDVGDLSKSVPDILNISERIANEAIEGAKTIKAVTKDGLIYADLKLVPATRANFGFSKPPYIATKPIVEGVLKYDRAYYRFLSSSHSTLAGGQWIALQGGVSGLSAAEIKSKLALPYLPTMVQKVIVPAGTPIRFGWVEQNFGELGGIIQHQILGRIPLDRYNNAISIEQVMRNGGLDLELMK